jgi:uncharacterized protein DUF2510
MTSQTPPGWYPDPYGTPGLQRYWDGSQWTQLTQPADEWAAGGGGAAQENPPGGSDAQSVPGYLPGGPSEQSMPGYLPGGAEEQAPPEYGQQQPPAYGQQGLPEYGQQSPPGYGQPQAMPGQQAPGYGYQQPSEYGQPQSGWPSSGGAADWNTGGQQAWPQQPPTSGKSNKGLMWGLIGGGAVVAAIVVVVVLFATGVIGGEPAPASSSTAAAPSTAPSEGASAPSGPGAAGAKSPVTGTISDDEAGLSYAQLGGTWQRPEIVPPTSSLGKLGFNRGAAAVVQTNYNGPDSSYVASVYSGALSPNVRSGGLEQAAKSVFNAVYPDSYPTPNTRKDLESKSYTVSGKKAWLYKVQLGFPQAKSKGWNFSSETAVVVTVELQSGKPPAMFYISIPDSHKTQGDLDLLLGSLKAL